MPDSLLPKRFLFRFSTPCLYREKLWMAGGDALDAKYRLTSFAELEGLATFADVRAAWNESGMALTVRLGGKEQAPWCPTTHPQHARARQHPEAIEDGGLKVQSEKRADGYLLDAFISADALTGFDPAEHPRLGFTYAVLDLERGEQTLAVGSPMPYEEDPSLWATLGLVG